MGPYFLPAVTDDGGSQRRQNVGPLRVTREQNKSMQFECQRIFRHVLWNILNTVLPNSNIPMRIGLKGMLCVVLPQPHGQSLLNDLNVILRRRAIDPETSEEGIGPGNTGTDETSSARWKCPSACHPCR
jgi:hypothetical protein